ncbi:hypothetical protein IP88_14535 [alpha proteobacterium AAP81b]|nr:hypothetical protein IP88_14535 [alpha proteobacterium AAP81b]
MRRIWLVANHASGSTSAEEVEALVERLEGSDVTIVERTLFPDNPLPTRDRLRAADADTLMIIGGDGTINAATDAAADWDGQCLVIPGGTMNLLPKALHGLNGREHIVAAAPQGRLVRLPLAEVDTPEGPRRALCGIILGPAASWVHAREGLRQGRFWRALRAARTAWARTFGGGVRVIGKPGRHRAVLVTPDADGLDVAMVDARGLTDALTLGWHWLTGDWRAAQTVHEARGLDVDLAGRRRVRALFDGEPAMLPSPVKVRHGWTRLRFIATRDVALEAAT